MLPEIDRLLEVPPDAMHAEYVACLSTLGTMVRAEMPNGENIIGRAVAVEPDGQLVVLDDCAVSHRINTADVVHLRPATD
jgi:BirA family biotin operon repressor/biotin-[acetyl-CoA-carboxylase] ligase